jgi:hypothetical protein
LWVESYMWRFAAGLTTGTSHLKLGMPCQDRFSYACLANGGFVAAIADGAGSAICADRGAEIAVVTAVETVSKAADAHTLDLAELLREAMVAATKAVVAAARAEGREAREFASTLLMVVATCSGSAALQIGDGLIVACDDSEGWSWVFWPERGEYANTTRFLVDEDAMAALQVEVFATPPTDIALMSDGLEPLALHYASKTAHAPFFDPLFRPLQAAKGDGEVTALSRALEGFLASPRVAERTDDDLSVVIATRRSQTPNERCS